MKHVDYLPSSFLVFLCHCFVSMEVVVITEHRDKRDTVETNTTRNETASEKQRCWACKASKVALEKNGVAQKFICGLRDVATNLCPQSEKRFYCSYLIWSICKALTTLKFLLHWRLFCKSLQLISYFMGPVGDKKALANDPVYSSFARLP